jgi:hypothetical protein
MCELRSNGEGYDMVKGSTDEAIDRSEIRDEEFKLPNEEAPLVDDMAEMDVKKHSRRKAEIARQENTRHIKNPPRLGCGNDRNFLTTGSTLMTGGSSSTEFCQEP